MTKEEIKIWFLNIFNSCYLVKHKYYKENYILYYDPQFIRQMKLYKITGKKIKYPEKHSGDILFYLNFKNGYLGCNNKEIWNFLENNYSNEYREICNLISDIFKYHNKINIHSQLYLSENFKKRLNNLLPYLHSEPYI